MATPQRTQSSASQSRTGKRASAPAIASSEAISADRIAARAYEIWQESGCPEGLEQEHWYQAERELQGRAAK